MNIFFQFVLVGTLLNPNMQECSAQSEYQWREFYKAIELVECYPTGSQCDLDKSYKGVYQISYGHWKLSQTPGTWQMCENKKYAQKVMLNYWTRFNPHAVKNKDFETLARMHNGGTGYTNTTDLYWNRVETILSGRNWWNGEKIPDTILNSY